MPITYSIHILFMLRLIAPELHLCRNEIRFPHLDIRPLPYSIVCCKGLRISIDIHCKEEVSLNRLWVVESLEYALQLIDIRCPAVLDPYTVMRLMKLPCIT